jgi:hypothetical protein
MSDMVVKPVEGFALQRLMKFRRTHKHNFKISEELQKRLQTGYVVYEEPIGAEEAPRMLGVSPRTVIKLAEQRELLGFHVGKLWKFYPDDTRDYINRQRQGATKPVDHETGEDYIASCQAPMSFYGMGL